MKATKKQLLEAYDSFFFTLRDHQGGTRQEQARQAQGTLDTLRKKAAHVAELMKNPSAHVLKDAWLFERCTVTIPERLAEFEARIAPANVIQFPVAA